MNKEACLLEAINQSARLLEFLETISRQIVMRMTFWPLSEIELLHPLFILSFSQMCKSENMLWQT